MHVHTWVIITIAGKKYLRGEVYNYYHTTNHSIYNTVTEKSLFYVHKKGR